MCGGSASARVFKARWRDSGVGGGACAVAAVCAAEGDLLEGAARLEAIFRDPERLAQHVDSLAVRELPRRTAPLVALERRSRVSATQASRLSGGVKRMVEDYAEAMALLSCRSSSAAAVLAPLAFASALASSVSHPCVDASIAR